jgi:hypothetical protein
MEPPSQLKPAWDDASQLWNHNNANILLYFNEEYPQIKPWQMRHLLPPVLSKLILLLCQKKWPQESPSSEPRLKKHTGKSGYDSVPS